MRLESVSLHGFKSFAEKCVLKVMPGITAIVGPNGCGKSNISESVRWALGEQSAKSLRGQKMEDLIFHGSASRKPVGFAEVELIFSNDGALSVPWTEVAVSRRLYRTGESEYLLNKSASRLRDILDLFAGTGANPRAYSVMDQDKLNHVLTAKPHERRVFIEEAAGIARYKQQRNETETKLDAARQNLVRVRDVMDEVRRQLNSLERQAKKAQQYKTLQSEKRELGLALVAADYAGLKSEGERLTGELARLRDGEDGLRTRLSSLAAHEAQAREALQASEHRLSDLRQAVSKVQGELERLLERREQMGVQIRELGEESVRLDEEVRSTTERKASIVVERENVRLALGDTEQVAAERSRAATEFEAALERQRAALAVERDHAEALRLEQARLASERVDLMRSAGELRERETQLARRAERLAGELAQAQAEAERLLGERGTLAAARDRAAAELVSLEERRKLLETQEAEAQRRLTDAETQLADARVELAVRRSSFEALSELERAREGYGAGVRAVFADSRRDALNGGALAIGGRNFDRAGTLFVTIGDGRLWTHTIDALPGAFSTIVRLASAGNDASASEYVELTVKMLPPVRAAIEQFDASASRGVLTFGQGWHEPELNPSTGRRWRWLSDRGELHYVTGPGASILHIEGESPRTYYARGSRLVIRAGDTVLKEVTLGDDFALDVPVPSSAEPSTLIVETDQIHVPADRGWRRTADRRRLGLRIYKCELR